MLSEPPASHHSHFCGAPWYAVYTRHQHEKVVAQILTNKGLKTFLPLCETTHHWKDRAKALSMPLFPCYVFLNGGLEHRLQILTTPGIHGFVSYGGNPAAIPDSEMEAIRRVLDNGVRVEPHPFLKYGDRVRIKSGALAGIEGILVRKRNQSRLVLSVEMLGKAASMEVDAFQVEPVTPAWQKDRDLHHPAGLQPFTAL
jgi:transcription antitermination factor NusG